jgi:carbon storage regulator
MLVISRRKGQRITIGDEIELVVTELHRSSVKVGIRAPRGYAVLRGEVRDSIETANRAAAETTLEDSSSLNEHLGLGTSSAVPVRPDLLGLRQSAGVTERQDRNTTVVTEVIVRRRIAEPRPEPPANDDSDEAEAG